MYVIGIDPHKGSHTAAVLDRDEELRGELRVEAGGRQRDQLLAFAAPFTPRSWAIEAATGWGALLAQQLVAAGETVLDVPPVLSARARLLEGGSNSKTDRHDARSAAIVALRNRRLRIAAPTRSRCAAARRAGARAPRSFGQRADTAGAENVPVTVRSRPAGGAS